MTTDRDAELSALLDGALSANEESALRDEIARVPELAARLEELAHVDAALRALPARAVPGNLRARLQAKLDAEAHAHSPFGSLRTDARGRTSPRRAWIAGFGAAAAAAAAAVVVMVGGPANDSAPAATGDLAVNPPSATAPAAVDEVRPQAVAEVRAVPSASVVSGDAGSGAAADQIARAVPAPAPTPRGEQEPEPGPAASESAQPFAADPSRVAIEETAPAESAFRDEELPLPSAAALSGSASDRLALASSPLYVEVTDDEADALGQLELHDATIVGVLDLLGELDELEAGAS